MWIVFLSALEATLLVELVRHHRGAPRGQLLRFGAALAVAMALALACSGA